MRAAAVALGDPAALAAVEQIELKLREMAETTNLLQQSVRGTFQSAFKDAFMSLATAGGFADGGWTGPGGKYKPAGIVHAEEFVHRREVVRQPGALPFLWDFNRRGMAALHDWRAGYAEGGLVTQPSISASPSYSMGGPALSAPSIKNSMTLYNYFDMDALPQALARHPAMEKTIVNVASQNGQTIQAEWQ